MASLRKFFRRSAGEEVALAYKLILKKLKNASYILTLLTILILLRNFLNITDPIFLRSYITNLRLDSPSLLAVWCAKLTLT